MVRWLVRYGLTGEAPSCRANILRHAHWVTSTRRGIGARVKPDRSPGCAGPAATCPAPAACYGWPASRSPMRRSRAAAEHRWLAHFLCRRTPPGRHSLAWSVACCSPSRGCPCCWARVKRAASSLQEDCRLKSPLSCHLSSSGRANGACGLTASS